MVQKLASAVTKYPKRFLLVCCLLLIPCVIGYFTTGVNYDILSYLPEDLESVEALNVLDDTFQFAASSIVILEDMTAKDIVRLKEKIEKIDCVADILWTDSVIDTSIPVDILPDFATDVFYSADGQSTMFIIQYSSGISDEETLDAIASIRTMLNQQCFISGISTAILDIKDICEKEAPIYIAIAIVVALATLFLTMEGLLMPVALFTALGFAVIYNMGTNFFLGKISFITQCIAAVLQLGVTMDYSIFLIDRFEEELKKTPENRQDAMERAIVGSFKALMGSSLTTVFGFLALCFMSLTLGFDIGFVMAKGVFLGVVTVLTLLPAILLQFYDILTKFRHRRFVPHFDRISAFAVKHRKPIFIVFAALLIPSFIAKNQVKMYYNMLDALPADTPSIVALTEMKQNFNMATTHFIIVNDETPAKDIEKMLSEIKKLDGIDNVLGLNTFVGAAIDESILPDIVNDLCNKDGYGLIMVNSEYDAGTEEENEQIEKLNAIVKKYDSKAMTTGEGVLTSDLVTVTNRDFLLTSIISVIAIFILIMIVFRSVSIPALLVLCIELAIFINQAISWITGDTISFIAPTVISCVQLGATVDYAILMTTRYRDYMCQGISCKDAARKACAVSMESIFQSALVFFTVTISVTIACDIDMIQQLCLMLARGSVISAMIIMLVLAPALCICNPVFVKTSSDWPQEGQILSATVKSSLQFSAILRTMQNKQSEKKKIKQEQKEQQREKKDTTKVSEIKPSETPVQKAQNKPNIYIQPLNSYYPPSERMRLREERQRQEELQREQARKITFTVPDIPLEERKDARARLAIAEMQREKEEQNLLAEQKRVLQQQAETVAKSAHRQKEQKTSNESIHNPVRPDKPIRSSVPVRPGQPIPQGVPFRPGQPMQQGVPVRPGQPIPQGVPVRPGQPIPQGIPVRPGQPIPQGVPVRPVQPIPQGIPVRPGQPMPQGIPVRPGQPIPQGVPVRPGQPIPQSIPGFPVRQRMPQRQQPQSSHTEENKHE